MALPARAREHGLAEDPVAELRLDGRSHDQIYSRAEDALRSLVYPKEVEEADGPIEVDETIDVAVTERQRV